MSDWSRDSPVRIRLTSSQADRLRGDWYYGQATFDAIDEETVIKTFGESQRDYVFKLIRWLGPGAELLEPREWRGALRDKLGKMADQYKD